MNSNNGFEIFNSVMEYYQGHSSDKRFKACERCLDEIIDIATNNGKGWSANKIPLTKFSEPNKRLCKILADIFDANILQIYWKYDGTPNAMTITPSAYMRYNAKYNLDRGKSSITNIFIICHTDLITIGHLNSKELLAFILHEIGHNFYVCPIQAVSELFIAVTTLGIIPLVQLLVKVQILSIQELREFLQKSFPKLFNIVERLNIFIFQFIIIGRPLKYLISRIKSLTNSMILDRINITLVLGQFLKYGDEKGADSFAAKYGYGPDLISGLKKLDIPEDTYFNRALESSGDFGNIVHDIYLLSIDIIASLTCDPHPNDNQRTQSILKKLKKDYATGDFPPSVKKELEFQIKEMEKSCETITAIDNNPDGPQIRKDLYDFINKATDGKSDLRELLNFYFDANTF